MVILFIFYFEALQVQSLESKLRKYVLKVQPVGIVKSGYAMLDNRSNNPFPITIIHVSNQHIFAYNHIYCVFVFEAKGSINLITRNKYNISQSIQEKRPGRIGNDKRTPALNARNQV